MQVLWCLQSARRLTLIDICMTFLENSLHSFEFKERTQLRQFCDWQSCIEITQTSSSMGNDRSPESEQGIKIF